MLWTTHRYFVTLHGGPCSGKADGGVVVPAVVDLHVAEHRAGAMGPAALVGDGDAVADQVLGLGQAARGVDAVAFSPPLDECLALDGSSAAGVPSGSATSPRRPRR
ncbi:hypothetical protein ACWCQE_37190 [Streptomyces sp. NPDC002409]